LIGADSKPLGARAALARVIARDRAARNIQPTPAPWLSFHAHLPRAEAACAAGPPR
jgi:hypothetical protein